MPYNVKLIQYGNGTFEIRLYDSLMDANTKYDSRVDIAKREENVLGQILRDIDDLHLKVKKAEREEKQLIYNPFTGQKEKLIDISDDAEFARSMRSSRNRTIQSIYKYARQAVWNFFVTLTFNREFVDRFDYKECNDKVRNWLKHQHSRFAPDLKYLFVPEQHKSGAWHFHGLISDVGDMAFADSGHTTKTGQVIYNLSGWRFGFSTATSVTDTNRVSGYVTKYITKDLCGTTQYANRFLRSRNLGEPVEDTFLIEGDKSDFIETMINSLGVDLIYKKRYKGLFPTEYLYYK